MAWVLLLNKVAPDFTLRTEWIGGKIFMNLLEIKGWVNVARGKIIQNIAAVIHNQKQFIEGKQAELVGRIQQRTGEMRGKRVRTTRHN